MASGENLLYILLMKMLSGNDEHFKRLYLLYFFSSSHANPIMADTDGVGGPLPA